MLVEANLEPHPRLETSTPELKYLTVKLHPLIQIIYFIIRDYKEKHFEIAPQKLLP